MNDRPDLPSLERVDANLAAEAFPMVVLVFGALVGIAAVFAHLYLRYRGYFGTQAVIIQGAIVLFALIGVWVAIRGLTLVYHWSTDPDGVSGRSILRRTCLRWSDVKRAANRHSAYGLSYTLETEDGRRTAVTPFRPGFGLAALQASTWQHLRRAGKAETVELPEAALSLWDEIPDSVPSSIEWADPESRVPMRICFSLLTLGLAVMTVGVTSSALRRGDGKGVVPSVVLGLVLAGSLAYLVQVTRRIPTGIVTNDTSFETTTPGSGQKMRWDDVASVRWVRMEGSGDYGLDIRAGDGKPRILVPYRTSDEASSMLILSVIRRLRTAGHPQAVPIPDGLRTKQV